MNRTIKKRAAAGLLALCILCAGGAGARAFDDVAQGHWAYEAVSHCVQAGYFAGTGEDTFSPDEGMSRAMFVTVLSRMAEADTDNGQDTAFADVPTGQYYTGAVAWAAENGLVNGVSDTRFAPHDLITREQLAVLMVRFAALSEQELPQTAEEVIFADAGSVSPYAAGAVRKCQMAGLLEGMGEGRFVPQGMATRAQAAAIITRLDEALGGDMQAKPEEITVTFEVNGGSAVPAQTVQEGQPVKKPADPLRSGYRFDGWFADPGLTQAYAFDTPVTQPIILYAKWSKTSGGSSSGTRYTQTYTVSFDTDGGTQVSAQTVEEGACALRPADPVRSGYSFYGWYLEGRPYAFTDPVTKDITLFARWSTEVTPPADESGWVTDRAEPRQFTVADGWITLETNLRQVPAGDYARYQGKGLYMDDTVDLTTQWDVSSAFAVEPDMFANEKLALSLWVQVDGVGADRRTQTNVRSWAIVQLAYSEAEQALIWQYWNNEWLDMDIAPVTEEGVYEIAIRYQAGEIVYTVDGQAGGSYTVATDEGFHGLTSPSYVIVNALADDEETYTVRVREPQIRFVEGMPFDSVVITDADELSQVAQNQQDGQTWLIKAGTYDLDGTVSAAIGGQTGEWLLPLTADGLRLIGFDQPVITSTSDIFGAPAGGGAWNTQNLITVSGNETLLSGLTITPSFTENKTIEIVGDVSITIEGCVFTPLDGHTNAGLVYFNGETNRAGEDLIINGREGTVIVRGNTFAGTAITLGSYQTGTFTIADNHWTAIGDSYAVGNTSWGTAESALWELGEIHLRGNRFDANPGDIVIMARQNQIFYLEESNLVGGIPAHELEELLQYLAFYSESDPLKFEGVTRNFVYVGDALYHSAYQAPDSLQ